VTVLFIDIVVLMVATILAGRVLAKRPVRREVLAHPVLALAVLLLLAAMVFAGRGVLRSAVWRQVIVGIVGSVTAIAIVRARPHYGRRAGLPPGSLGLATSLDAIDDQAFYAKAEREWGSVFKMSQVHQPVVCIVDLALAHDLFRTHGEHLAPSRWSFNRLVPGGYVEYMQGDAHAAYRGALGRGFAAMRPGAGEGTARLAARDQLQAMSLAGAHGVDPEPLLLPVAMSAMLHAILGVDRAHPRAAALTALFTDLIRPMELLLPVPGRARTTFASLVAEVRLLGAAVANDGSLEHQSPSLLGALVRHAPDALRDPTLVGNLVLMVKEGSIMVRGLLRWVLKMHADHPELSARLRDTPGEGGAFSRRFVLEVLRLHESRYVYRRATRDLPLGTHRIPRGWLVRLCVGEAHERETHFPEPQTFNPDRFTGDPLTHANFAPFGQGAHACLGGDLTLAIAQAFVEEAARHFEVRTTADGPPWRINRHWGLWRPSQAWRVRVVPRA
jgi:cytochrome P450